ncbi:MAG TPA: hypothetical protein VKT77_23610 [Chthonomonadaceae bacterium]|nr:hypothetical protein [Chthonomonadaceae bacterium]
MEQGTRREFLHEVGKGVITASVGASLAAELGAESAMADHADRPLSFGRLEPLAAAFQERTAEQALPLAVERLSQGGDLREIVAAAALANARAFGGEDYVGFHAFMALMPAYLMSRESPQGRKALPVLKVLYRSTGQIQAKGGRAAEVLHTIGAQPMREGASPRAEFLEAERGRQTERAEGLFAAMVDRSATDAFDDLQALVHDDTDVHRVVLAYRAWDLLGLTGREHAHTTLRQSVRYCLSTEKNRVARGYPEPGIRATLPKVLDQYRIAQRMPGTRAADETWLRAFVDTLLSSEPAQAAEAVGAALADGFSLDAIGEALSLAATQQVLRDPGRTVATPGKPVGSVHGDSVGVHASDSMSAWRNIAKVCRPNTAMAGLIVAGYHLSFASGGRVWKGLEAYPRRQTDLNALPTESAALLRELDGAIRENDQARAAALARRYGDRDHAPRPIFDMFLRYATSEDGALHAEKYYRTVADEFARSRKSTRWQHVTALARVTASEYGKRADGYEQACSLLKITS